MGRGDLRDLLGDWPGFPTVELVMVLVIVVPPQVPQIGAELFPDVVAGGLAYTVHFL